MNIREGTKRSEVGTFEGRIRRCSLAVALLDVWCREFPAPGSLWKPSVLDSEYSFPPEFIDAAGSLVKLRLKQPEL